VEELEVKFKKEEPAKLTSEVDQKKKPGVKDTIEINKLKKEVKMKMEELDKYKTQAKKVSTVTVVYYSYLFMSMRILLEFAYYLPRLLSL
jgi:hypothetical protein